MFQLLSFSVWKLHYRSRSHSIVDIWQYQGFALCLLLLLGFTGATFGISARLTLKRLPWLTFMLSPGTCSLLYTCRIWNVSFSLEHFHHHVMCSSFRLQLLLPFSTSLFVPIQVGGSTQSGGTVALLPLHTVQPLFIDNADRSIFVWSDIFYASDQSNKSPPTSYFISPECPFVSFSFNSLYWPFFGPTCSRSEPAYIGYNVGLIHWVYAEWNVLKVVDTIYRVHIIETNNAGNQIKCLNTSIHIV